MPLALAAGFYRIRVEKRFEMMNLQVFSESAKFATESVGAIRTVTALTLEDIICQRYELLLQNHVKEAFRRARFATLIFAASDSLPLLAMAFVLWYAISCPPQTATHHADVYVGTEEHFLSAEST